MKASVFLLISACVGILGAILRIVSEIFHLGLELTAFTVFGFGMGGLVISFVLLVIPLKPEDS